MLLVPILFVELSYTKNRNCLRLSFWHFSGLSFFSSSYTAKCQNLMQQIIKDHREHTTFFPHSSIEHFSAVIFSKKLQHVHFQKKCNVFFLLSLLSFKQSFKPPCLKNKVKRFCVLFGIDHRCDEFCISKPASAALVALASASSEHQQRHH